jgi:hypothetical protein
MDAQGLHFIGLERVVLAIRYRVRLVIFTVELTALFVTLWHIEEAIQPPEKCLILTDSLSSVKVLVYECK